MKNRVERIEKWDQLRSKLTPTELVGVAKFKIMEHLGKCDYKDKVEER